MLELILTNGGQGTVDVNLGASNVEYLVFDITVPGGGRITVRPLLGDGFQTAGRYRLGAADREVVAVAVSDLASFSKPGWYTVAVTFSGGVYRQGAQVAVQREAKWPFTLAGRDTAAIQRRCEELPGIIQQAADESIGALTTLTAMRDAAAVPYLLKSAEARGLAVEEVAALSKIGGPEARAALQKLAQSRIALTASVARAALARMK